MNNFNLKPYTLTVDSVEYPDVIGHNLQKDGEMLQIHFTNKDILILRGWKSLLLPKSLHDQLIKQQDGVNGTMPVKKSSVQIVK